MRRFLTATLLVMSCFVPAAAADDHCAADIKAVDAALAKAKGPISQFIAKNYRHFNAAALLDAAKATWSSETIRGSERLARVSLTWSLQSPKSSSLERCQRAEAISAPAKKLSDDDGDDGAGDDGGGVDDGGDDASDGGDGGDAHGGDDVGDDDAAPFAQGQVHAPPTARVSAWLVN